MPTLTIPYSIGDNVWVVNEHKQSLNYGEILAFEYIEHVLLDGTEKIMLLVTLSDSISNCIIVSELDNIFDVKDDALIELATIVDESSKC